MVHIPLKGTPPSKVDIFVTTCTLKVNFSPYLIDLVLHGSIDALRHKATVKDGTLSLTFFKQPPASEKPWGRLVAEEGTEAQKRADAMAAHDALQKDLLQQRRDRRVDDERFSLRKQMGLEESERTRLDTVKQEEKSSAEEAMYKTFAEMQSKQQQQQAVTTSAAAKAAAPSKNIFDTVLAADDIDEDDLLQGVDEGKSAVGGSSRVEVLDDGDYDDDESDDGGGKILHSEKELADTASRGQGNDTDKDIFWHADDDKEVKFIPPPRSIATEEQEVGSARISISFTPRVFPTPMRESKAAEEEDWVVKNRRHLKNHAMLGQGATRGVDVSEEDPTWLKGKGDDFFRAGDIRSAINAYSAAIDADETMTACFSNRSACYLKLCMYADCRADCSTAIAQLDALLTQSSVREQNSQHNPGMQAHRSTIHKLLLRRSVSCCHLGQYSESISDHSRVLSAVASLAALGMDTGGIDPAAVTADLARLRVLVDAEALKKQGDAVFAESRLHEALEKYNAALELMPLHVCCLSNRSACKIAVGDLQGCIEDCTQALELLQVDPSASSGEGQGHSRGINMLLSVLPPAGSERRLAWVTRTVTRRGTAYSQLNKLAEAIEDYRYASSLNPLNEALKADLEKLAAFRESVTEAAV